MRDRAYSGREFEKILLANGYRVIKHQRTSHVTWSNGNNKIIVNMGRPNPFLIKKLIKANNLDVAV